MKHKPVACMKRRRCRHEAKRAVASPCAEGTLHRAKPCFIFHAPQARFIEKSTCLGKCFFLAGVAGFGPTNARVKVWCLTAWLYPNISLSFFTSAFQLYHNIALLSRDLFFFVVTFRKFFWCFPFRLFPVRQRQAGDLLNQVPCLRVYLLLT